MSDKGWYIVRENQLAFSENNAVTPTIVFRENAAYPKIIAALKSGDFDRAKDLANPLKQINLRYSSDLKIEDGEIHIGGEVVSGALADRVIKAVTEEGDVPALIAFHKNLMQNPDFRAIGELPRFLDANNLPITKDGYLLAYKSVRNDYKDHHSGTVSYNLGFNPKMDRAGVNNNPNQTCSAGLHACAASYFSGGLFGGDSGSRAMLVKINPKDVVSVPVDYDGAKMRCCEMSVIAEFKASSGKELIELDKAIKENIEAFSGSLSLDDKELRELVHMDQSEQENFEYKGKRDAAYFDGTKMQVGAIIAMLPAGTELSRCTKFVREGLADFLSEVTDLDLETINEVLYTSFDLKERTVTLEDRYIVCPQEVIMDASVGELEHSETFEVVLEVVTGNKINLN